MTPDLTDDQKITALKVRQANCAHRFIPMGRREPERCVHCGVDESPQGQTGPTGMPGLAGMPGITGIPGRIASIAPIVRDGTLMAPAATKLDGTEIVPLTYWTPQSELEYAIGALSEARDSRGLKVMLCHDPQDIKCVARELTRMLSIVMEDDLVEHSFTKRYDTSHWFRNLALLANLYAAHLKKARHE